jgi:prolipoprotein diacylglyceryl transferase
VHLLASIPSPAESNIELGPVTIHMYGLMLLLGIAAGAWLTAIRWRRRGGDWDLILRCTVWGVAFGIVGARLYHVITSWSEVPDEWWGPFAVWKGGLGIWGGIAGGVIAGAVVAKRAGQSVRELMDVFAPGILLAQAIGRWGNWWNQELFGEPTDLPWALEIGVEHRPAGFFAEETFHPVFLYEFLWNLAGVGLLLLIGWRFRIRAPGLFALYVAYYCFGRFFEELIRIDPSHEFAGLRLNAWVSIVLFVLSVAFFIWWQFVRPRRRAREPAQRPGPKMAIPRRRVRPSG